MPITVTYTNDAFPSDQEFGVEGVGVFVNGQSKELTEDEERAFVATYKTTFAEWAKDNESWNVNGTGYIATAKDALGVDPAEITNVPQLELYSETDAESTASQPAESNETLDLGGEQ